MSRFFTFLFLIFFFKASAQKFMIHGKDTLPYKEKMVISHNDQNSYLIKQVDYSHDKPIVLVDKPFFKFTSKYLDTGWFMVPFILSFFVRLNLNSKIYNIEEETDYVIRTRFATEDKDELDHLVRCAFTIWFFKYKPESRKLVIISNLMSIIFFCICAIEVLSMIEMAH